MALLFLAYLRVSRTYPENSDESNDLLMAWDMLHGNVLLHGWYLSDVSFITTELPQYALLVWLFGLHADTAHIAAAMTYTLVVILAVLLARGRVSRREGRARMLLTAGLVFAPQLGVGVFVLLLSLGHIGTAVPLLLTWLVIDSKTDWSRLPAAPRIARRMVLCDLYRPDGVAAADPLHRARLSAGRHADLRHPLRRPDLVAGAVPAAACLHRLGRAALQHSSKSRQTARCGAFSRAKPAAA